MRRAARTNSWLPHSTEPTGAQSPLLRQKVTESTSRVSSVGSSFNATALLKIRAPSRCTFRSCRSAISRICAK